jgi:hypothetical protein
MTSYNYSSSYGILISFRCSKLGPSLIQHIVVLFTNCSGLEEEELLKEESWTSSQTKSSQMSQNKMKGLFVTLGAKE